MNITLEFPGFLAAGGISSGSTVTLEHPVTILELLQQIGIRDTHIRHIQPFVNQVPARMDHQLKDEDHIFLYIPVGGG